MVMEGYLSRDRVRAMKLAGYEFDFIITNEADLQKYKETHAVPDAMNVEDINAGIAYVRLFLDCDIKEFFPLIPEQNDARIEDILQHVERKNLMKLMGATDPAVKEAVTKILQKEKES